MHSEIIAAVAHLAAGQLVEFVQSRCRFLPRSCLRQKRPKKPRSILAAPAPLPLTGTFCPLGLSTALSRVPVVQPEVGVGWRRECPRCETF